jgi:hypothetical protein
VEILAGRSEYTQAFVSPDGTATFKSTVLPARVRRADGSWVGVDTTLRARTDGSYAPAATVADLVISGGGTAPFVTYREQGSMLTLAWPTVLPAPAVSGSTAVYRNVLPDVDLRVTAGPTGFRHVLVVKTRAAASNPALASIRYQVGGDLLPVSMPGGRVRFVNGAGVAVAATQNASMWDSSIDVASAGELLPSVDPGAVAASRPSDLVSTEDRPGTSAVSAQLPVSVGSVKGLIVTPDTGLLTGAGTVFPVFIDPQIGPTRSKWAWANNGNHSYDVNGQAWIGLNPPSRGGDGRLYRAFFDFPTSSGGYTYRGKHVLSARFSIRLDHSWSCGDTWTHIYRTGAITVGNGARMSWGTRPLGAGAKWLESAAGHANEAGGCGAIQPDLLMEYGNTATFRGDVQAAADGNANTYTIGICACNADGGYEASQDRWKRFHVNADTTMSVTFNTIPGDPTDLSPTYPTSCGGVVGTTSPHLQAKYVDADPGDRLSATFEYRLVGSTTSTSVAGPAEVAPNNVRGVTVNLGSGAENKAYEFRVRTFDKHDYSKWSAWCRFTVDTRAPPAPTVAAVASGSAPVYAECPNSDAPMCTPNGGPGVAGAFTFTSPAGGQDVVKYIYGWDSPSFEVRPAATGGPVGPILLTPPRYGINTLTVYSVDGSGKSSPTVRYTLLVRAPSQPLGYWPLDSFAGHNLNDMIRGAHLTTTGDVAWTPDARYVGANALSFDANLGDGQTGYAATSGPVLDTTKSFSVSAWARLASLGTYRTVVSQNGASRSRFMIYYSPDSAKWMFVMYDQDGDSTAGTFIGGGSPVAGRWTHLLGVYDAVEKRIGLYVDGVLVASGSHTPVWAANGAFTIGRGIAGGASKQSWRGEIADVRAWDRVVVSDDIWGTDPNPFTGVPAQAGILQPLKVGSWQFPDGECHCGTARDDSLFGRHLYLSPNWTLDPNWNGDPATTPAWLTADSHDGNGGLALDGLSGSASTTDDRGTLGTADDVVHPVLRTDQSFTVAAWVRLDSLSGWGQSIVRQGNTSTSAMTLHLRDEGRWALGVTTPDGAGGYTWVTGRSDAPAQIGVWVHLVGTFDASTGQARLYVDGQLQSTFYTTPGVMGTGWHSTGSLLVGRAPNGDSFSGVIDQVHVWQGVLTAREIQNLYQTT